MLCLESKRMNLFPNTSKIQHRTILKYCMGRVIHTVVPSHVEMVCRLCGITIKYTPEKQNYKLTSNKIKPPEKLQRPDGM